jgi:hypothetical protein
MLGVHPAGKQQKQESKGLHVTDLTAKVVSDAEIRKLSGTKCRILEMDRTARPALHNTIPPDFQRCGGAN